MRDFTQLCDSTQNSISSLKGFQFLLYWWSSIIQDTVESVYNGPPRDLRNWLLKVARLDFLGLIPPQFETSFVRHNEKTRKSCEHGPENGKPKFNQTKRRSDNGGSAGVDCHIYRRRNKYLQRRHGPWKHEKEYAACNRPESWYLEKYKTELNLNSISKTFQGTYHISIATLNFQCFRLDTSFLWVLPPKR